MERSSAVRNALGDVQKKAENGALTSDQAAAEIVGVVEEFGLRPVDPPPLPEKIRVEDLPKRIGHYGRYWDRTSDLLLVRQALYQLS